MPQARRDAKGLAAAGAAAHLRLMPRSLLLLALLPLLLLPPAGPAAAQDRYESCLRLAREQPAEGLERAQAWRRDGGGVAARHCAAAALAELGRHGEAAAHLRAVADAVDRQARPALLAELAWLLMLDGRPEQAETVQSEALSLVPDDLELRIDRAITRADRGRWWDAIDDLNHASELAPERIEVLILRAEAYRRVEAPELALDDLERALTIRPDHAEAMAHRGVVRFELGDLAGAAEDWQQVLRLDPDGAAARIAERNLEQLEDQGG